MPNWCQNKLVIHVPESKQHLVENIKDALGSNPHMSTHALENGETHQTGDVIENDSLIVFNKIIPMPKQLLMGDEVPIPNAVSDDGHYTFSDYVRGIVEGLEIDTDKLKQAMSKGGLTFNIEFDNLIKECEELVSIYKTRSAKELFQMFESGLVPANENGHRNPYASGHARFERFVIELHNAYTLGYPNWYTWRLENWSTKWEPSSVTYMETLNQATKEVMMDYYFDTAWGPANNIIIKIKEILSEMDKDLSMEYYYYEGGMHFGGSMSWSDGKEEYLIAETDEEKRNIAEEQFGWNFSEFEDEE